MLTATGIVTLLEVKNGSTHINVYKTRLALVLDALDQGTLGEDMIGDHGSDAHVAALRKVLEEAGKILHKIEHPPPRTCNRHDNCDEADAKAKARGAITDHCHDENCEDCFGS